MSDSAITVHNLYRFFGPLQAVNGISFEKLKIQLSRKS